MPALIFIIGLLLAYVLAALAAIFRLRELGYQRFFPLVPVFVVLVGWMLVWLPVPSLFKTYVSVLAPLLCFGFLFFTLCVTWSVTDPSARVLRIVSGTLLGYAAFMLFLPVIT